jgi:glyoxylase-like metal-dependent hydrolase (beta-lactamase superfamily II)/ferredoxin
MASTKRRLATNVEGDFYVDDTCIDCETCRWMAPRVFDKVNSQSRVYQQPQDAEQERRAMLALISCPTASIGFTERHDVAAAKCALPDLLDANVYHCGYHAESSFGAASYLIRRPQGNVLVDSPRWATSLVRRLEDLGGVRWMFLTHRDDVADHRKYHEHFSCERVLHADDRTHGTGDLEVFVEGEDPVQLDAAAGDLWVIPTPGHTRGSACLLHSDRHLFTGDHLAFGKRWGHLYAFRSACWYDWQTQIRSMEKLAELHREHPFQWVLPGHGRRWSGTAEEAARQMKQCVEWMRRI